MAASLPHSLLTRSDNSIQFSHQLHTILTNDNYLVWKSQILPVLRGYNLMCYVDGSDPPPSHLSVSSDTVPAPNPAFQRWHQHDQLILA
jgi:hypothetical protein